LERRGLTAHDYSRSRNNGTLTNIEQDDWGHYTYRNHFHGPAVDLEGGTSNEKIVAGSKVKPNRNLSMSVWCDTDVMGNWDSVGGQTTSSSYGDGFGFYFLTGQIHFFVNHYVNDALKAFSTGSWAHFVGTYDSSFVRIYVNGVEGTPQSLSGVVSLGSGTYTIGQIGNWGGAEFNGRVANCAYWDRTLSAREVWRLYNDPWAMFRRETLNPPTSDLDKSAVSVAVFSGVGAISGGIFSRAVTNTVEFSTNMFRSLDETVPHTVEFSQSVDSTVQGIEVSHSVKFTQQLADVVPKIESVDHSIAFGHVVSSTPQELSITSNIEFGDNVAITTWDESITASVKFSATGSMQQIFWDAIPLGESHTVKFTQSTATPIDRSVYNNIRFSQSSDPGYVWFLNHKVQFTDSAVMNFTMPFAGQTSLIFSHAFLGTLKDPSECKYDPIIGGGSVSSTMPAFNPSSMTKPASMTLVYPAVADSNQWTKTATLRNAEIGDRTRYQFDRIFRESAMGSLQVAHDADWPDQETVAVAIRLCKTTDVTAFSEFVSDTLGEDIGFLDWESNAWRGIMLSTAEPIVYTRDDVIDITFEFVILGGLT
jgi:hypothetical protein